MPVVAEIVCHTGSALGTVRRKLGTAKTIQIEFDFGNGFNERLAFGAALTLDQEDAETRDLRAFIEAE